MTNPRDPVFVQTTLPAPTHAYDREYMLSLVRSLEQQLATIHDFQYLRVSGMVLADTFPVGNNQLRAGAVYVDDTYLRVARINDGFATTQVITSGLGAVTVTVT